MSAWQTDSEILVFFTSIDNFCELWSPKILHPEVVWYIMGSKKSDAWDTKNLPNVQCSLSAVGFLLMQRQSEDSVRRSWMQLMQYIAPSSSTLTYPRLMWSLRHCFIVALLAVESRLCHTYYLLTFEHPHHSHQIPLTLCQQLTFVPSQSVDTPHWLWFGLGVWFQLNDRVRVDVRVSIQVKFSFRLRVQDCCQRTWTSNGVLAAGSWCGDSLKPK